MWPRRPLPRRLFAGYYCIACVYALADSSHTGTGSSCAFHLYNETDCTKTPYQRLHNQTLASCCAKCEADNQCRGFTLERSRVCDLALGSGVGRWGPARAGCTCGTRSPLPPVGPNASAAHGVDRQFDCAARRLALQYSAQLLGGRGQPSVFEALQLKPAWCVLASCWPSLPLLLVPKVEKAKSTFAVCSVECLAYHDLPLTPWPCGVWCAVVMRRHRRATAPHLPPPPTIITVETMAAEG